MAQFKVFINGQFSGTTYAATAAQARKQVRMTHGAFGGTISVRKSDTVARPNYSASGLNR
jgi:hypothetical protein